MALEARASMQISTGMYWLMPWCFRFKTHLGGGRELAFGQAVDAVILDDVNHRGVAAHHMLEAAHADGGGIAIAGDADGLAGMYRQTMAPVASEDMRPCRPLKPKERFRK